MELLKNWFRRSFADPQVVILGLFLVIGFAVIIGLGKWLAPMFASLVVAYLLEALVQQLQKISMPRSFAVLIVFLLFLAILVFLSAHWFGIRLQGVKAYLRHYLTPSPVLLPFHIISEITRTIALAVRLFGNIMSLEMAALLILLVAGFLAPIPILMLHIIEALVQAYIFGMLALIYVAGGIQSQQLAQQKYREQNEE